MAAGTSDGRGANPRRPSPRSEHRGENAVAKIEDLELTAHRGQITADVRTLIEKYRAIFDWDVPDIDQAAADRLILAEVRKALNEIEQKLLG